MRPARRGAALLVVPVVAVLAGCGAAPATPGGADNATLRAAQAAVARINATAGGPVAAQRAVLDALADPAQQQAQQSCGVASGTLSFEPVWADLRADPVWQPSAGGMTGTVWSVPTVVRVRLGARIDATDLANLHFTIVGGAARTSALCVN
jgi:hypothetical protein